MIKIGFVSIQIAVIIIPIILPLIIGAVILTRFHNDEQKKLIGVFTIKPVIDYLLFWVTTVALDFVIINISNLPKILQIIVEVSDLFLPPLLTTTIILYRFRHLFYKSWLLWFLLGLDIIRLIFQAFALILENTRYGHNLIEIWLLSPSLYAVIVLIVFLFWNSIRNKPKGIQHTNEKKSPI